MQKLCCVRTRQQYSPSLDSCHQLTNPYLDQFSTISGGNCIKKFIALARARGFAGILLGTEQAPNADEDIDRKKSDGGYEVTDTDRKEKKRLRQANGNAYINLQLSCEELPYDLVSLAKTEELPDGCTRDAWKRLTSEYDLTEGEDKITLLSMFQQN